MFLPTSDIATEPSPVRGLRRVTACHDTPLGQKKFRDPPVNGSPLEMQ